MTRDPCTECAAWARESLRDMACPGVSVADYLRPVITYPVRMLTHHEARLRQVVNI